MTDTLNIYELIPDDRRILDYKKLLRSIPLPKIVSLPADYAEKNIKLTRDVSPITGRYSYDHTPYWREPANRAHPRDSAKVIIIVKDGQSGATQGVVVPVTTWTISDDPCNIMVTSGNEVLSKEFVSTRLDPAIKSAGIMHLIRPNTIRAKNAKTGNTDYHKQFAGGNAFFCSIGSIDTVGKQKSLTKGIFDDYSAGELNDKKQGALFNIIQQRFNTSATTQKQYFISTMENSPDPTYLLFLQGDQRKWHVPCPHCDEFIELKFSVESDGENCGVLYDKDERGLLIHDSVRYKCQNCHGEFLEKDKYKIIKNGKWIPTAKPLRHGWYSYQKTGLVNPAQFDGWNTIIEEWIDIFSDGETDTEKLKAFKTLRLGEPYEDKREHVSTHKLLTHCSSYESCIIPDNLSLSVGAGRVALITAGVDCGGTEDDARLDYEIVAWTENGQSFSIATGEIGTHSNNKKIKDDETRDRWTYRHGQRNCVWDMLEKIMNYQYKCESGDGYGVVSVTAIDSGWMEDYVTQFIDQKKIASFAVKGEGKKLAIPGADRPFYKKSSKINGLVIVETNHTKEEISRQMERSWDDTMGDQPSGYMNFPLVDEMYGLRSFFEQMTGEERVPDVGAGGVIRGYRWTPRKGAQNHKFDCRNYAFVARQVFIDEVMGKQKTRWSDYVTLLYK